MTDGSEDGAYREIVSRIVANARDTSGNAEALSVELQKLGIKSERGERYSISAISNWVQGRTMPPADVFLAVAKIGEQSIDTELGAKTSDKDEAIVQLQSEFAKLQAEMMNLRAQVGAAPQRSTAESEPSRRTGTGG